MSARQPKMVQVKLLVPYAIIVTVAFVFVGVVTGWNLREQMSTKVSAEVSSYADRLKVNQ